MSAAGQREMERTLGALDAGDSSSAHEAYAACAGDTEGREALLALRRGVVEHTRTRMLSARSQEMASFFTSIEMLPEEALCVLRDDEGLLHIWPVGESHPCRQEPLLKEAVAFCGTAIRLRGPDGSTVIDVPRAKVGEWHGGRRRGSICPDCADQSAAFPICLVPGARSRDPLPRALAPKHEELLGDLLERELSERSATALTARAWLGHSEDAALRASLQEMTVIMAHQGIYGERALQRLLGREPYDGLRRMADEGGVAPLAQAVPDYGWRNLARKVLDDPDAERLRTDAYNEATASLVGALRGV
jgi:hypothetical protein